MLVKNMIMLLLAAFSFGLAQQGMYDAGDRYPYGHINPDAPPQLSDFAEMVGQCECKSVQRNPDGTWQDTLQMRWQFKYILNGLAIQDETWRENGFYATSIRQFNKDSLNWVVSYYSSKFVTNTVSVWTGNREGDEITLKMPQKSPQGYDGFNRLTFYKITNQGFRWRGEWLDLTGKVIYPFWNIECRKL